MYGQTNGSYDVTLDNTIHSFSPTDGLLYSNDGLIEENHVGSYIVYSPGCQVEFSAVILTAKPTSEMELLGFGSAIVTTTVELSQLAVDPHFLLM